MDGWTCGGLMILLFIMLEDHCHVFWCKSSSIGAASGSEEVWQLSHSESLTRFAAIGLGLP